MGWLKLVISGAAVKYVADGLFALLQLSLLLCFDVLLVFVLMSAAATSAGRMK